MHQRHRPLHHACRPHGQASARPISPRRASTLPQVFDTPHPLPRGLNRGKSSRTYPLLAAMDPPLPIGNRGTHDTINVELSGTRTRWRTLARCKLAVAGRSRRGVGPRSRQAEAPDNRLGPERSSPAGHRPPAEEHTIRAPARAIRARASAVLATGVHATPGGANRRRRRRNHGPSQACSRRQPQVARTLPEPL